MGVFPMHCSANIGKNGDSAVFFGLSGTGKTTLSADPNRMLIGDDEHGWADDSVFNFEGGCYAKCINLSAEKEPDIYNAIRFGALVENVVMDPETREFDFDDDSLAVNSRVGYPIEYINNAELSGVGAIPKTVIFLTADAYGVLPPISKLDKNQAMYYFVSGFTSKLAGTEIGVKEPVPTFSTCFGEPFLPLDPSIYAAMLAEKVEKSGANVYLVNTGWNGTGKRIREGRAREGSLLRRHGSHRDRGRALRASDRREHLGRQGRLRGQGQGAGRQVHRELQEVHPHERGSHRRGPQGLRMKMIPHPAQAGWGRK